MMDEEREDAEEALQGATASQKAKKDIENAQLATQAAASAAAKLSAQGSKETGGDTTPSPAPVAVPVPESFMGRFTKLVKGGVKEGDPATATLLAEVIDEAVGTGKLGTDKLTVAELQLLDDISRGSVVSTDICLW